MLRTLLSLSAFLVLSMVAPAWAQVTYEPLGDPSATDDVDEVEELPPALEPPSTAVQEVASGDANVLPEELRFSQDELRSRFDFFVAAAVGSAKPWQGYTLEMGVMLTKDALASLGVGGGSFKESGFLDERAYDVKGKSRGLVGSLRWYSSHFPHLAGEAVIGYAAWEGRVDPKGSDVQEVEPDERKLSSGFRANGVFAGLAVGLTWIWDNGLLLDWTPVGMQVSRMQQKDYDRDTDQIDRAVKFAVERPSLYGLMNFKLGYIF